MTAQASPKLGFDPDDPIYRAIAWIVAAVLAVGFAWEWYAGSGMRVAMGATVLTLGVGTFVSWGVVRWRRGWRRWWPHGSVVGVAVICLAQVGVYAASPDLTLRRDLRRLAVALRQYDEERGQSFVVTRRSSLPEGFRPSAGVDLTLVTPLGWWTATASRSDRACTLWDGEVPARTQARYPELRDDRIWCRAIDAVR